VVCSSWLSVYANKSFIIVGETTLAEPVAAYSRLNFWREDTRAHLNNQTITDVIYYGGNMSALVNFLQENEERFLLIVNKRFITYEHHRLRPYYETKIPSVDSAKLSFQSLSQLSILNKNYESESLYLFLVTRER
jgi:hypothetical protein